MTPYAYFRTEEHLQRSSSYSCVPRMQHDLYNVKRPVPGCPCACVPACLCTM